MRVSTVGIILLAVALSLGGEQVLHTTARAAWARTSAPRSAPQLRHAPASRLRVTVTAYSHSGKTASGRRVRPGVVALSRDLEQALGVTFGGRVVVEGVGTFVFEDRVSARLRRRVDIFMPSTQAAHRFGVKVAEVRVAEAHARGLLLLPPPGSITTACSAMCALTTQSPTCGQEEG
jgi:3D (Asp-Asp-Asp) domain-containing protein